MEAYLADWLSLIVRWLHLITGIAWIGASFHFVWLDNSLQEPPDWKKEKGIKGDLWSIHGGGIYEFNKYALAPPSWPATLHWSKWEAYTTWITGIFLIVAVYYVQAQSYLVGPDNWISEPTTAIFASVGFVGLGLGFYEIAVRSPLKHNGSVFAVVIVVYLGLLCWLSTRLFSDRAAYMHIGAVMGTIMAGNVFLGIIPAQKSFVKAVEAGFEPDAELAAFAKLRSTHNNYFTLPVLFCMISNHYPFLYGHQYNWVILVYVMGVMAYARHFFNLRHQGIVNFWILARAIAAFLLLATYLGYERFSRAPVEQGVSTVKVKAVIEKHCSVCHSANPTYPGFAASPAGIVMDTMDEVIASATRMKVAVETSYMPLGNVTNMSAEERRDLLGWLDSQTSVQ